MHHALPGMLARARGGILNVASLGGLVPGPYQAVYYASKAYVVSLTEAVAAENAGRGVRFTAVAPGPVNTGFHVRMGLQIVYRQLLFSLNPERVANSAYRGYVLGFRVVVPGLFFKPMWPALRVLPHRLLLPLIGWLPRPRAAHSLSTASPSRRSARGRRSQPTSGSRSRCGSTRSAGHISLLNRPGTTTRKPST